MSRPTRWFCAIVCVGVFLCLPAFTIWESNAAADGPRGTGVPAALADEDAEEELAKCEEKLERVRGELEAAMQEITRLKRQRDESESAAKKATLAVQDANRRLADAEKKLREVESTGGSAPSADSDEWRRRAETAEAQVTLLEAIAASYKGVVTIRNPTSNDLHYSLRWQGHDGEWSLFEDHTVKTTYRTTHTYLGAVRCEVKFDYVAGDNDYTEKRYTLDFLGVPQDRDISNEDGRRYYFNYNDAGDRLELYGDTQ